LRKVVYFVEYCHKILMLLPLIKVYFDAILFLVYYSIKQNALYYSCIFRSRLSRSPSNVSVLKDHHQVLLALQVGVVSDETVKYGSEF
jgi:hypothetical protein